jgi:hypothetical protein
LVLKIYLFYTYLIYIRYKLIVPNTHKATKSPPGNLKITYTLEVPGHFILKVGFGIRMSGVRLLRVLLKNIWPIFSQFNSTTEGKGGWKEM